MAIKDLKKWLDTECPKSEIKYLDEANQKGAYIPIGIIEQNLDEFDNWGTEDFRFQMMRVDKNWVASGTVWLVINHGMTVIKRHGSTSFPIGSKLNNDDFEGTALSLAIANAAKKLGKRFGRHLNGRLELGEKAPVIDLDAQRKLDAAIDEVNDAKTLDSLMAIYEKYSQYQKSREFIVAFTNMKGVIKIREANGK
jgi:hypothetical protein